MNPTTKLEKEILNHAKREKSGDEKRLFEEIKQDLALWFALEKRKATPKDIPLIADILATNVRHLIAGVRKATVEELIGELRGVLKDLGTEYEDELGLESSQSKSISEAWSMLNYLEKKYLGGEEK